MRDAPKKRKGEIVSDFHRLKMPEEVDEEFEPLFDYSRVQPLNLVSLDDDEETPSPCPKRRKGSDTKVEKNADVKTMQVVDCDEKEDEDWLPPPPKISSDATINHEDPTIKELRLKKQELAYLAAQSADTFLKAVEESVKRNLSESPQASLETATEESSKPPNTDKPSKPHSERAKIIISVQDKDGAKQFRIYTDDKFERLFKLYADKVKLELRSLVFTFDGDKVGPQASPDALGMEDNDIIEVQVKSK